jgi:hypothetical protein
MNKIKLIFSALVVLVFSLLFVSTAEAQASRTFVSVFGNDANPCNTPLLPCRQIQAAITKVQAGGEVVVISSGSYQPFIVNKSVTVTAAPGEHVGISVSSGNGATISAASTDVIVLRGLTFNGSGGVVGIQFFSGAALHVENCITNGFSAHGIGANASGRFFAKDTITRNNTRSGIFIATASGTTTASLDRLRVENNGTGINIQDNARLTIRDSVVAGNNFLGLVAGPAPTGTTIEVGIESCQFTGNLSGPVAGGGNGVTMMSVSNSIITNNGTGVNSLPNGIIRVSNTTIVHNGTGVLATGGSVLSRLNNTVEGNTNDGLFTGTFLAK